MRGYGEGGVGSGRSFVAGTAELHYPIYGPVEVGPPAQRLMCGALAGAECCARTSGRRHRAWAAPT